MKRTLKNQKGFTLIELLVVMGILAVLLAIVLIAINPLRQFAQAANRKRLSDVNAILNAVGAYVADNNGDASGLGLPATAKDIENTGGVDICAKLVPTYISALPTDPIGGSYTNCTTYDTKYTIFITNGRVTVAAPNTDTADTSDTTITVTR